MKKIALFIFTISLVACGGGSGGGNEAPNEFNLSGNGSTQTVNNSDGKTDVNISGNNHTVHLRSDVAELNLTGSNNLINFGDGVSVDGCNISGNDNTATHEGQTIFNTSCNISGSGNSGFTSTVP